MVENPLLARLGLACTWHSFIYSFKALIRCSIQNNAPHETIGESIKCKTICMEELELLPRGLYASTQQSRCWSWVIPSNNIQTFFCSVLQCRSEVDLWPSGHKMSHLYFILLDIDAKALSVLWCELLSSQWALSITSSLSQGEHLCQIWRNSLMVFLEISCSQEWDGQMEGHLWNTTSPASAIG